MSRLKLPAVMTGLVFAAVIASVAAAQTPPPLADADTASQSEIPDSFQPATPDYNYVRREVMIPMRDGVRLHTVLIIPKGLSDAPIILDLSLIHI